MTSEITRFGEEKKSSRVPKPREHGPNIDILGLKIKIKGKNFEARKISLMI
jgi:hypothetical protein